MKKYQFTTVIISIIILFTACDKSLLTVDPDFEVTGYTISDGVDSLGNVVKNVKFKCEGNANVVSFYSGELFKEYAFKDGRMLSYSSLAMSFTTTTQFGTQTNQLSVMASTDFNGNNTIADINAATWTDITNRFTLATSVGSTTPRASGTADVFDLTVEGKPLYIGFKYYNNPLAGVQSTWRIRSLLLTGQSNIGVQTVADQANAGWSVINGGPADALNNGQIESGPVINLRGNNANTTTIAESWAIVRPLNLSKSELGPDRPINIKRYIDNPILEYTYQYKTPGEYTVAFLAQNATNKEQKAIVKTLKIKID